MDFCPDRVFLIGMMGSGKSHMAKIWSVQSGFPFFDTDQLIEQKTGQSIKEIFWVEGGESIFREMEAGLLRETEWPETCFIACGGGLPCFHSNMDYMRQIGKVIWIHPPVFVLASRLWHQKAHRPLVAEMASIYHLELRLHELLAQRKPFYERAHLILTDPPEDFRNLDTPYI
jgi:shikimate kinase